ncbi:hypothetical protein QZH41_017718 [Actinostola sp. cb2023]|nr:hypothetical protein QZH41_017718 [Actinostola sp. cb2023]
MYVLLLFVAVNLTQICPAPVKIEPQQFHSNLLDPLSHTLYNTLSTNHMSSQALLSTVNSGGTQLNTSICGQFTHLKGSMSYAELLGGLLYSGETVIQYNQFQHLQFSSLIMSDECNATISQRPGGICLLTDKRLLLLSSQVTQSMSLSSFGDPKKLPGGYALDAHLADTTSYLPIPLRYVRSIEMNGQSGVHGKVMINGTAPCCGGLFGLCGLICGNANMLKQWGSSIVEINQHNQMVITIGVLMPPWEKRMFLNIHATITTPIPVVRDFISLLQQYAVTLN